MRRAASTPPSEQGSFDFVQDFGARLPAMVIASLLGVPGARPGARLRKLIDTVFHIEPGVGMVNDISLTAGIELHELRLRAAPERTLHPRDDMLTDLTVAEITEPDGSVRRLTIPESSRLRVPPDQCRHRDGGPPARLGSRAARRATRTSGPCSSPTPG